MVEQMLQYNVRLPRWLRDFIQGQPEPASAVRKALAAWYAEVEYAHNAVTVGDRDDEKP